jgi:hypothetical protein
MSKKRTTIEHLEKIRKKIGEPDKKKKKKGILEINPSKHKKKKYKYFKKNLNKVARIYFDLMTEEEQFEVFQGCIAQNKINNIEEMKERRKAYDRAIKQRDERIEELVEFHRLDTIDDAIALDKIIEKEMNGKSKRLSKFGYDIEDGIIIQIDEDKVIKQLKKQRKELDKINKSFIEYFNQELGITPKQMERFNLSAATTDRKTKDLIKSFKAVAVETNLFKLT